jgi:hypothetical protein
VVSADLCSTNEACDAISSAASVCGNNDGNDCICPVVLAFAPACAECYATVNVTNSAALVGAGSICSVAGYTAASQTKLASATEPPPSTSSTAPTPAAPTAVVETPAVATSTIQTPATPPSVVETSATATSVVETPAAPTRTVQTPAAPTSVVEPPAPPTGAPTISSVAFEGPPLPSPTFSQNSASGGTIPFNQI